MNICFVLASIHLQEMVGLALMSSSLERENVSSVVEFPAVVDYMLSLMGTLPRVKLSVAVGLGSLLLLQLINLWRWHKTNI